MTVSKTSRGASLYDLADSTGPRTEMQPAMSMILFGNSRAGEEPYYVAFFVCCDDIGMPFEGFDIVDNAYWAGDSQA
jgi:hypothetical protein